MTTDLLGDRRELTDRIRELEVEVDRLRKESVARNNGPTLASANDEHASSDRLAREFAEAIAYRGDDQNRLYRAFLGSETPMNLAPSPVPFSSTLCQQAHFGLDQYRFWARAMKDRPKFLRKQWEFVYIAQSLFERGQLTRGKRGLVFGVGREPLPSLFASFGCEIVATDQSIESAERGGWITTGQHAPDLAPLNERGICTDAMFRALVSFAAVDMNDIPRALDGTFDFCWSACSLEHLGSLRHGLHFIERSLDTLKPGGVAVHTTEFNLSSNDRTIETADLSLYRRRDIEALVATLNGRGYKVAPIDWSVGEGFAERVVDLPPFGRGEPHLRLRAGEFDMTSIGLIVEKPTSRFAAKKAPTARIQDSGVSSGTGVRERFAMGNLAGRLGGWMRQPPKAMENAPEMSKGDFEAGPSVEQVSPSEEVAVQIQRNYSRDGHLLYQKMLGASTYSIARPGHLNLTSSICRQTHFTHDEYRYWAWKVKETPGFHRKQWEWFFILQALWEHGKLGAGQRGLGFGVGQEPLPAAIASFGAGVVATDQSIEGAIRAGWLKTNEHSNDLSKLNDRQICDPESFERLVSFESADMNDIPSSLDGQFDFCWSACCFEHLGSLEHGLRFVENAMRVLKPGGVAVHTTEYNLSSNSDTVESPDLSIYRRDDILELAKRLEAKGFNVAPLQLDPTDGFVESIVDVPPYKHNPHIRLAIGNYVCTSVGIIVRKV